VNIFKLGFPTVRGITSTNFNEETFLKKSKTKKKSVLEILSQQWKQLKN
jgi:hypothetical protein